jgi:shikimate kinase
MPGVGKSTVGVLLAKALSCDFLDTDVMIQAREGRRLQEIIDGEGMGVLCRLEEEQLLGLSCEGTVVATGGSAVYSKAGMAHLQQMGVLVYLRLALAALEKRMLNLESRGVVREPGQDFRELYEKRRPLYERYAEVTIDCDGLTMEKVVGKILAELSKRKENAE